MVGSLFFGRYSALISDTILPARAHSLVRRRVCERLVVAALSFRATARGRVAASASRIAEARAPHLPNRGDPPKADGEDCLKFLSGEAWKGTSSTAE